jgi:hypothetical protein
MSLRDTPKVDRYCARTGARFTVESDFARTLERERNEFEAKFQKLYDANERLTLRMAELLQERDKLRGRAK